MLRFHYASGSPFSWRVQIVLEEKGIPYEPVLLSFQKGDMRAPEYQALSPHGKVPAIVDGPARLYESTAIVEYLEEQYPEPALLPAPPAARALVRIEELECLLYFADGTFPAVREMFFRKPEERNQAAIESGHAAAARELERLERRAVGRGGDYLLGSALTRADLVWLPFLEFVGRAGILPDPARVPWVVAWRDRMRARPSFDRSYPPHWKAA